jgi:hypothetical protein
MVASNFRYLRSRICPNRHGFIIYLTQCYMSHLSPGMGMFDELKCHIPMPDGHTVHDGLFQTKSLWRSLDLLTITTAGRLIFHQRRYDLAGGPKQRPLSMLPILTWTIMAILKFSALRQTVRFLIMSYALRMAQSNGSGRRRNYWNSTGNCSWKECGERRSGLVESANLTVNGYQI